MKTFDLFDTPTRAFENAWTPFVETLKDKAHTLWPQLDKNDLHNIIDLDLGISVESKGWWLFARSYCWCEDHKCPHCTSTWPHSAHETMLMTQKERRLRQHVEEGFAPLFVLQSPKGQILKANWYKHIGRNTTIKTNLPVSNDDANPVKMFFKRFLKEATTPDFFKAIATEAEIINTLLIAQNIGVKPPSPESSLHTDANTIINQYKHMRGLQEQHIQQKKQTAETNTMHQI